ncbi:hypothetical protein HELRODRAFT_164430 [Helobdella robusta]|uniref:DUF1330 domain-containing protein n=1 Tax=Helobdella robusta TaxID=6412 RepID=T1EVE8_HELRO|nr:hypothetical protein HELRODRAFT_164430 [Helobdella robusta]ESN94569.1 hypothetical protein HELRODRAFT_164430 [Helobdella robusta]
MSLLKNHRGPVFVIIRFPYDLTLTCKNALMKTLSIHANYSGCISGICTSMKVLEGNWPGTMGVAILTFKSLRDAELWKDSVPDIKQPDWLRGVDMLIVPIKHLPAPNKGFVQIMDMCLHDLASFEHNYACEAKEVLNYWGACAGVVSAPSDCIHKVKGLWDPNYLIINFWPSCQVFEEAMKSDQYKDLMNKRNHFSASHTCVFQLQPIVEANPCLVP